MYRARSLRSDRASRCRLPVALAGLLALPAAVLGATPALEPDACGPRPGDTPADIVSVSDTLELRLADGRLLRLAGLDPPLPTPADPGLPAKARVALEAWAKAGPVTMRSLSPEADRWGRIPALLFHPAPTAPSSPDGQPDPAAPAATSAADALLGAGWVRAKPERAVHECFTAFLATEDAARTARRGVWADPRYAVLGPDAAEADVAGQTGGMAVAQGILRVHESHGTLYLTLGRDPWGLTAVLPRRMAERFAKAGYEVPDYAGTAVRLRGDLDDRFGPRLRLDDPDGFESLEPGSEPDGQARPATSVSAKHWTSRAPGR